MSPLHQPRVLARLRRMAPTRPILCWGTGRFGQETVTDLAAAGITVVGFIDSDPARVGSAVMGLPVEAPSTLGHQSRRQRPFVLVASMYASEILPLLARYGLAPPRDVLRADDLASLAASRESAFTLPRPDCPHPEWWHAHDSDSTELEVIQLVAGLVRGLQPHFVVETGSCRGFMAEAIGRALRTNGHGCLVSLEVDPARCDDARIRCRRLPVTIVHQSSLEFQPSQPIDFAWFDSLPELRIAEFRRYQPWLRSIVGFHDTGPQHMLRPGLEALAAEGHIRPIFLPTPRGICLAEVLPSPVKA